MSELGTDRLGHGMLGTTADFFTMGSAPVDDPEWNDGKFVL